RKISLAHHDTATRQFADHDVIALADTDEIQFGKILDTGRAPHKIKIAAAAIDARHGIRTALGNQLLLLGPHVADGDIGAPPQEVFDLVGGQYVDDEVRRERA